MKAAAFLEYIRTQGCRPEFVLDIGANGGDWTRMAKKVFPEASFLLVEPQPKMREHLNALCRAFDNVTWVEAGAGARQGRLVQTIWEDLAGSSFLPQPEEALLRSGKQRGRQHHHRFASGITQTAAPGPVQARHPGVRTGGAQRHRLSFW